MISHDISANHFLSIQAAGWMKAVEVGGRCMRDVSTEPILLFTNGAHSFAAACGYTKKENHVDVKLKGAFTTKLNKLGADLGI